MNTHPITTVLLVGALALALAGAGIVAVASPLGAALLFEVVALLMAFGAEEA